MIIVRSIKPATAFKSSVFREEIQAAAKEIEQAALKDFQKTTQTWKHKPDFDTDIKTVGTQSVTVQVTTDNKVYGYVDAGTRPHIIKPKKRGNVLAFAGGKYRAKTKPRVIGSTSGGASGAKVFAKEVHHPGTDAREFTETIAKKWKPELQRVVKNALARAARRSGRGV
jgi:hypothetical protein